MLVLALAALVSSSAHAQSKRYPVEPVDKDKEKAARSELWENATAPETKPYARLVAEAKAALNERTDDQRLVAVAKLTDAIALVPEDPDAYAMRGEAQMELREWAKCVAANNWPAYPPRVAYPEIPAWEQMRWDERQGVDAHGIPYDYETMLGKDAA